jgi:phosphatidate cytidylyltransferase
VNPRAALESPVFLAYAAIIVGLVVVSGLILVVLTYGFRKNLSSVWSTYHGWLVMAPLVLGAVFLGRFATIIGVGLLSLAAFKEYARATGLYRSWPMVIAVYAGIIAVTVLSATRDPGTPANWGWYGLFMVAPIYIITLILMIPIVQNRTKGQLQNMALAIQGFILLGWMVGHIGFLANSRHAYGYLLFLVLAVELCDVAAFVSGKLFGKRKFRDQISPNKTWGGAFGAFALGMLLPWVLWFGFQHFEPLHLVLAGLIVGIGGQLGDLTISVIKRDLGVKDMGVLIPGHGGLMDRMDSLIFAGPLFLHMVRFFHGLY